GRVGQRRRHRQRAIRLPDEYGFQVRVRKPITADDIVERLTVSQLVEQPRPTEGRPFGDDVDGEQALVVRDLRFGGTETAEAAFEVPQRNRSAERFHPASGGTHVGAVEVLRQSFIEPRRNTARSNARNNRVGEFMRQNSLKQLRLLCCARHLYANSAVVLAACPRRGSCEVAELLLRVEDGDDGA